MTYLITAKDLFSATILVTSIKQLDKELPKLGLIKHSPLFLEVQSIYIGNKDIINLLKEHAIKVVCKKKLKNSTKYTTMEL